MTTTAIITTIVIGAIAGWLAGLITKGRGFGLLSNIVIGIAGSFIGGWFFGIAGLAIGGMIGAIVSALVGAIILLFILSLIRKLF